MCLACGGGGCYQRCSCAKVRGGCRFVQKPLPSPSLPGWVSAATLSLSCLPGAQCERLGGGGTRRVDGSGWSGGSHGERAERPRGKLFIPPTARAEDAEMAEGPGAAKRAVKDDKIRKLGPFVPLPELAPRVLSPRP